MQKKSFSWGLAIFMYILIFPIGIWMIIKKMTVEKQNYAKNAKTLRKFGFVILVLGAINFMMDISSGFKNVDGDSSVSTAILMLALLCGGGLVMVFKSKQFAERGAKYSRYESLVQTSHDGSIDNIAASYPATFEQASADLQEMIDAGFFPNMQVNLHTRQIEAAKAPAPDMSSNKTASNASDTTTSTPKSMKCPNCGATNTFSHGTSGSCEYCGSPLG